MMGRWLKKITDKANLLTDKPDTMETLSTMSGMSVQNIGAYEKNNVFQHSLLQKSFDEQCIKQFYDTKYARHVRSGAEAQHQALNDLILRFIDITQVSYGSLEVRDFIQRLYKVCGIPLMKDLYHEKG